MKVTSVGSEQKRPAMAGRWVGKVSGGGMTEQENAELWRLRMRWLGIYHVAMADGVWCAKRYHDVTHVLTANTVGGLAEQIQHDYAELA